MRKFVYKLFKNAEKFLETSENYAKTPKYSQSNPEIVKNSQIS